MNGDFLPEFKIVPAKCGGYLCSYRLFDGKPFRLIPGEAKETAGQALNAAKAYVREKLNPPIQATCAKTQTDKNACLGVDAWHEQRVARAAEAQEAALGGIIVKGRQVIVERRRVRA